MKKIGLLVLALYYFTGLYASPAKTDSIPVNPKDVESVDAIVNSLYSVISGPAGGKRNWDRMRSLFVAEGRLMATGKRRDGSMARSVMTVEDYITASGPLLENDGFFEKEIGRIEERFGQIVHLFSSYEARKKIDDTKPFMRGINSFQLWNDGQRWLIVTILWEAETAQNPIPQKYIKAVKQN